MAVSNDVLHLCFLDLRKLPTFDVSILNTSRQRTKFRIMLMTHYICYITRNNFIVASAWRETVL